MVFSSASSSSSAVSSSSSPCTMKTGTFVLPAFASVESLESLNSLNSLNPVASLLSRLLLLDFAETSASTLEIASALSLNGCLLAKLCMLAISSLRRCSSSMAFRSFEELVFVAAPKDLLSALFSPVLAPALALKPALALAPTPALVGSLPIMVLITCERLVDRALSCSSLEPIMLAEAGADILLVTVLEAAEAVVAAEAALEALVALLGVVILLMMLAPVVPAPNSLDSGALKFGSFSKSLRGLSSAAKTLPISEMSIVGPVSLGLLLPTAIVLSLVESCCICCICCCC